MIKIIPFLFLLMNTNIHAQEPPHLEFFCSLTVKVDKPLVLGETPDGTRSIISITGGRVDGPAIHGEILPGGADWQIVRTDGVAELEAHYQFKTDDGVLIYIKNIGLRVASPEVAARIARGDNVDTGGYYFRTNV